MSFKELILSYDASKNIGNQAGRQEGMSGTHVSLLRITEEIKMIVQMPSRGRGTYADGAGGCDVLLQAICQAVTVEHGRNDCDVHDRRKECASVTGLVEVKFVVDHADVKTRRADRVQASNGIVVRVLQHDIYAIRARRPPVLQSIRANASPV